MKTIYAVLVGFFAVLASSSIVSGQTTSGKGIWSATISTQGGQERICVTALLPVKQVPITSRTEPNCGVYVFQTTERWLESFAAPRSPEGALVTGFRFNGWIEDGKAKIFVWALVNDKNSGYGSVEEEKLTPQLVESLLVKPGKTVVLGSFRKYGVKPMTMSVSAHFD